MAWASLNIKPGVVRQATPYDVICAIRTKRLGAGNTEPPLTTAKMRFAMAKRIYPSADRIRQLLDYDQDTGILTWRKRGVDEFSPKGRFSAAGWCAIWNSRMSGKIAGSTAKNGYVFVSIDNNPYPAHRIAYIHANGDCAAETIDHINGNPTDNRLCNLRPATTSQNHFNKSAQKNSKTGVKGVRFFKGKYVAQINVLGKRIHIGRFESVDEAASAHRAAAEVYHGEYSGHLRGENDLG